MILLSVLALRALGEEAAKQQSQLPSADDVELAAKLVAGIAENKVRIVSFAARIS